jgi:ABC-type glycerol-3-phosphate transport system substrate-binding protein
MIRHITKAIVLLTIAAGLAGCAKSETVKPDEPAETETVATEVAGEKEVEEIEIEEKKFPYIAYLSEDNV